MSTGDPRPEDIATTVVTTGTSGRRAVAKRTIRVAALALAAAGMWFAIWGVIHFGDQRTPITIGSLAFLAIAAVVVTAGWELVIGRRLRSRWAVAPTAVVVMLCAALLASLVPDREHVVTYVSPLLAFLVGSAVAIGATVLAWNASAGQRSE